MAAPKLRFKEFDGDWISNKIIDLADYVDYRGKTPKKVESGILLVTAKNIKQGYLDYSVSQEFIEPSDFDEVMRRGKVELNDVLITTEAPLGNVASVDRTDIALAQRVIKYRGKIDLLDNLFLKQKFLSESFQEILKSKATGGTVQGIKGSVLHQIPLIVPSKQEQTKIASFLSAVDEKISQLTQKHELLSQYKQGMMQKLFSQQIRFKADDGSEFGEWEEKTIEQIANFRRGSFPQPYGLPEWLDSNGFPFVQVYDVSDKMLLKERTKIKISQLAADQSVFAKQGTLIVTIQGSIGRIAKMQYDAYVDRTLLIFQSYNCEVDVDYFKYALFLLFNIEKERAEGAIIKTITKETLSKFIVQLPCPEEQTKIANFLSAIDQKIEVVAQQIEQAKQWKKGLLQQMFV